MKEFLQGRGFNTADWIYGLMAAFVSGGASAVTSGITVTAMDPADFNLQTGRFYTLVGALFAVNGLMGAMMFLKQKPLPDVKIVETVVQKTEMAGSPPVPVMTKVTETRAEQLPPPEKPKE